MASSSDSNKRSAKTKELHKAITGVGKGKPFSLTKSRPGLQPHHVTQAAAEYKKMKRREDMCPCATPLLAAVQIGSVPLAKYLVEEGADVNEGTISGVAPLSCALINKNFDVANFLILAGAHVNAADPEDRPPLYFSIQKETPVSVVQNLLAAGAEKDAPLSYTRTRAITRAVAEENIPIVKFLLEQSVDVNYPITEDDATPLNLAINLSNYEITKLLVHHGANVEGQPIEQTPLMSALMSFEDVAFLKALIEAGVDVNRVIEIKHEKMLKDLSLDEHLLPPLQFAVALGSCPEIEELIKAGADVNAATPIKKRTALHQACLVDYRRTENSFEQEHRKIVQTLIEHGADLDGKDINGRSPAKCCYVAKNFTAMEELIKAGIDVNENLGGAGSILTYAVMLSNSKVIQLCLERGGDSSLERAGIKAYQMAYKKGNMELARLFFKYHPVDDIPLWTMHSLPGCYPPMYRNQFDFFSGLRNDDEDAVRFSLQNGAEPRAFLKEMRYPIFIPVANKNLQILKLLLDKGVVPNVRNENRETPLHVASKGGFVSGCYELLKNGACYNAKSSDGQTPLDIAEASSNKNRELIKLLKNIKKLFLCAKGNFFAFPKHLVLSELKWALDDVFLSYLNCVNRKGNTMMQQAIISGCTEVAEAIMTQRVFRDMSPEPHKLEKMVRMMAHHDYTNYE